MPKKDNLSTQKQGLPRQLIAGLLNFFYPIHYGISMEVEARMCLGRVSRQQAAILWLIHSEVGPNGWIRRRVIERMLNNWFETSNSHVSQMLKELSNPPLSLVMQMENPTSAREKLVGLTAEGRAFFQEMLNAGIEFLESRLGHFSEEMARSGIRFYSAVTQASYDAEDSIERAAAPRLKTPAKSLAK